MFSSELQFPAKKIEMKAKEGWRGKLIGKQEDIILFPSLLRNEPFVETPSFFLAIKEKTPDAAHEVS